MHAGAVSPSERNIEGASAPSITNNDAQLSRRDGFQRANAPVSMRHHAAPIIAPTHDYQRREIMDGIEAAALNYRLVIIISIHQRWLPNASLSSLIIELKPSSAFRCCLISSEAIAIIHASLYFISRGHQKSYGINFIYIISPITASI